jgi:hypothetical protein
LAGLTGDFDPMNRADKVRHGRCAGEFVIISRPHPDVYREVI